MFYILSGLVVARVHTFVKTHSIMHISVKNTWEKNDRANLLLISLLFPKIAFLCSYNYSSR